ncbi:hypothetical protein ACF0H5_013025 [Mactra antiquata]
MNVILKLIIMIISFTTNGPEVTCHGDDNTDVEPEVTCHGDDKTDVDPYCIETKNVSVEKIIPEKIYKSYNIPDISSNNSIELSFCPNINFLKVHLMLADHNLEGNIFILCYRKAVSERFVSMATNCYQIILSQIETAIVLDCWFPIHLLHRNEPLIEVWTSNENQLYNQYGSIRPQKQINMCTDECETTIINIISPVICYKPATIILDKYINVHHITFHPDDVTQCSTMTILNKTEVELKYMINCDIIGKGHIKVLYSISDKYCLKYQTIHTHCPKVVQNLEYQMRLEEAHSFGVFVLFGLGCMVTVSSVIATFIFTYQKFQPVWTRIRRKSKDLGYELRERETDIQLLSDSIERDATSISTVQTPVKEVIKKAYIKRMDSYTSDGQSPTKQTKPVKVAKTRDIRKLHKCVTVALLEHTDELYRKRILVLPRPYDSFSRDATNLLKTVFTMEGGIPSQCCFDRDVYSQFITGDKHQWIQQTLSDRNRILIFLCFTSIVRDIKCNTMVTDILDHLVLSRVNSPIFCKVIFLYITDNSDNLSKYHHGDSYYINHAHSYRNFVENVLCFCGKNADTDSMLIHQLITCDASTHFLKFVGVENIK